MIIAQLMIFSDRVCPAMHKSLNGFPVLLGIVMRATPIKIEAITIWSMFRSNFALAGFVGKILAMRSGTVRSSNVFVGKRPDIAPEIRASCAIC